MSFGAKAMSFPCKRESRGIMRPIIFMFWIPTFVGMTVRGKAMTISGKEEKCHSERKLRTKTGLIFQKAKMLLKFYLND